MKYIFSLLFVPLIILSGCMSPQRIDLRDHIVDIWDRDGQSIWRGVMTDDATLMTVTHVLRECQKVRCRYTSSVWDRLLLDDHILDIHGDKVTLPLSLGSWLVAPIYYEIPLVGMSVYALVSRSGSWSRIDGKIVSVESEYIAYDTSLSGTLFTWAIMTDILLEKWESGTPIWSLSGWLIGVMSAVDREGKKGWVVR